MSDIKIAGIPAEEWIGRRAKAWSDIDPNHPCPCIIKGIDAPYVLIKPMGHKRIERVLPDAIAPLWSHNDDLRQKYKCIDNTVDSPEDAALADAVFAEEETDETPDVTQPTVEVTEMKKIRMVIENHAVEWLPVYQKYQEAVRKEMQDRALMREVLLSVESHIEEQRKIIQELALLGVTIIDEDAATETQDQPITVEVKSEKVKRKRINRGRITIDIIVKRWGRSIREQLEKGEPVDPARINTWAKTVGVPWKALQSRLNSLEKALQLKFTDEEGRTGNNCRGICRVSLV